MALDFPNTPTLNQTFTGPNGTIWMWDGVKWVAITSTSTYAGAGNVGRNLLHNPLFNVAQRGAGPWTVTGYGADRWQGAVSGDTYSMSVGAMTDAGRSQIGDEAASSYLACTFTGTAGAGALTVIYQPLEGVRRLAGKTVTVSFWANASAALKLGVSFDQNFGTVGSPSATVSSNGQSITTSGTWTRYSMTFAIPSISGKTLGTSGNDSTAMFLWYSSGATNNVRSGSVGVQSGTINLWGVQLEIGSVATPLEKPDPRYDLANCQRFALVLTTNWNGYSTNGLNVFGMVSFPVTMRTTPTTALSSISYANASAAATVNTTPAGCQVYCVVTATGSAGAQAILTASADL